MSEPARGHTGGGAGQRWQVIRPPEPELLLFTSGRLPHSSLWRAAPVRGISRKSAGAHLLPRRWVPAGCHAEARTGGTSPLLAGLFQVEVWFLNVAAPSLRESEELSLEGLLAAFHLPLPHTQTAGLRTLGAKKGGVKCAELHGQVR